VRRERRHLSGQEKKEDLKAAFHLHRCDEHEDSAPSLKEQRLLKAG